jgi:hypothetical protein
VRLGPPSPPQPGADLQRDGVFYALMVFPAPSSASTFAPPQSPLYRLRFTSTARFAPPQNFLLAASANPRPTIRVITPEREHLAENNAERKLKLCPRPGSLRSRIHCEPVIKTDRYLDGTKPLSTSPVMVTPRARKPAMSRIGSRSSWPPSACCLTSPRRRNMIGLYRLFRLPWQLAIERTIRHNPSDNAAR